MMDTTTVRKMLPGNMQKPAKVSDEFIFQLRSASVISADSQKPFVIFILQFMLIKQCN